MFGSKVIRTEHAIDRSVYRQFHRQTVTGLEWGELVKGNWVNGGKKDRKKEAHPVPLATASDAHHRLLAVLGIVAFSAACIRPPQQSGRIGSSRNVQFKQLETRGSADVDSRERRDGRETSTYAPGASGGGGTKGGERRGEYSSERQILN
ncbi:hypothetical protein C8R44DRAFT_741561 [Mycena epipterygia]|nr:hypothetical protein C8R44DRAFT_741561 [Mycena epipterygia]